MTRSPSYQDKFVTVFPSSPVSFSLMYRLSQQIHRHYLLSALLLGCLVLRAFVPAGYMLDTDVSGTLSLKMCSGITLAVPIEGGGDHDSTSPINDGPTGAHGTCPAGVPLLALAQVMVLSAEITAVSIAVPPVTEPALSSIPPSPSRLPRGPPTSHA
jgi:hypothetical protein